MTLLNLTAATGRFAAARRVGLLAQDHPCARLHGHNFQATAFAALAPGFAAFPGGEVQALDARLQDCLRPLQYADLNAVIAQPTDENLARWIATRLDAPGVARIAVQSTPQQGVDWIAKAPPTSGGGTNFRRRTGCPTCPRATSAGACMATALR